MHQLQLCPSQPLEASYHNMTIGRIPSVEGGIQPTIFDAKADILTATAADTPARLAVGANDTVLTADSSTATGLKWAAVAAGGKVLQVVQATYSTATAITSTTATDSGLSGSITPSSASSKVLILVSQPIRTDRQTSLAGFNLRLMRGATAIYGTNFDADGGYSQAAGSTRIQLGWNYTITYLDSPATTSSVTYKTQLGLQDTANSAVVTAQITNQVSSIVLLEIGA
jgi:hypothetical protein